MSRTLESVTFDVVGMIPRLFPGCVFMQVRKPTVRCVAGRLFMRASVVGTWRGGEKGRSTSWRWARDVTLRFSQMRRVSLGATTRSGVEGLMEWARARPLGRISTPAGSEIDDSFSVWVCKVAKAA